VLNVIDDYSRECLACIVDTSLSGRRVVRELTAIAERRELPCMVVSDNVLCREAAAGFGQQISMRRQPSARYAF
jgi:transposase InsO family protein